jgi:hypothetical protein
MSCTRRRGKSREKFESYIMGGNGGAVKLPNILNWLVITNRRWTESQYFASLGVDEPFGDERLYGACDNNMC